jgi:dUTPase
VVRGFIDGLIPPRLRPGSFDLTVGRIVVRGEERHDPVVIQPQQTFLIESEQTVTVPIGYVGYAMPKTSLCNDGILVLNTGLVDPGYNGKLSTIAINFSDSDQRIRRDTAFLRLVFHQLTGADADREDAHTQTATLDDLKSRSRHISASFLDVPGQADRIMRELTNDVMDRQRNAILLLISTIGFLFVMWNLGSFFLLSRQTNAIADRTAQTGSRELGALEERVKQLDERVARLQTLVTPPKAR